MAFTSFTSLYKPHADIFISKQPVIDGLSWWLMGNHHNSKTNWLGNLFRLLCLKLISHLFTLVIQSSFVCEHKQCIIVQATDNTVCRGVQQLVWTLVATWLMFLVPRPELPCCCLNTWWRTKPPLLTPCAQEANMAICFCLQSVQGGQHKGRMNKWSSHVQVLDNGKSFYQFDFQTKQSKEMFQRIQELG